MAEPVDGVSELGRDISVPRHSSVTLGRRITSSTSRSDITITTNGMPATNRRQRCGCNGFFVTEGRPGRLLEIGTATGSFLDVARRYGFTVRGLDLSRAFADIARSRYALDIEADFIEEAPLPEAHYDVICAFGGIVCWRDPVRGLRNIRGSLAPGGVFVLNYPNVDGILGRVLGDRYPELNHASLTIFSTRTMKECLKTAGLRLVFAENERQYASIGRIVTYLRSATGRRLAQRFALEPVTIPIIAFGTIFGVCLPEEMPHASAVPRQQTKSA